MKDMSIECGPFQPTWESLRQFQCPEWYRDAKLGIWSHWGPQAVPAYGDWYARNMYIQGDDQYRYHVRRFGHPICIKLRIGGTAAWSKTEGKEQGRHGF